jgi:hypothetical protein
MAYSMSIVSWGAIEWFQGYQVAKQDGYLKDMVKWGMDWLIQAHPQPNVFYVQVSRPVIMSEAGLTVKAANIDTAPSHRSATAI